MTQCGDGPRCQRDLPFGTSTPEIARHRLEFAAFSVKTIGMIGCGTAEADSKRGAGLRKGVAVALLWLWVVDGIRPTAWDAVGCAVALAGMAIIMFAPRGGA